MAKKKAKKIKNTISPEKYMQTKVRNLPVAECLITSGVFETSQGNIVISRKHASGNYTFGIFLVDTFCLGVRDCFYRYNISEDEYFRRFKNDSFTKISYNEAHNIVYGAVAYAADLGIQPHKYFGITQYILEPDTEDIPLIEYNFGLNGKPCLIVQSQREADKYLPILRKHVGDDFKYIIGNQKEDNHLINPDDLQNLSDSFMKLLAEREDLPYTEYSYTYPEYPKELKLTHEELNVFYLKENDIRLDKEVIDTILSLPRESLIEDLDNMILYEIGQTCGEITDEQFLNGAPSPIYHALFFLGELKAEEKLNTVLEVMRQNESFIDYHFGDSAPDVLPLTLYYTGRNRLAELSAFAKEPGLETYLKYVLFPGITYILKSEPERREEILDWYKDVLEFYLENVTDSRYYDATLTGMLMPELINISATELLPVIKQLFDTKMVDKMSAGDYDEIEKEIRTGKVYPNDYSLFNLYERYQAFEKKWKY